MIAFQSIIRALSNHKFFGDFFRHIVKFVIRFRIGFQWAKPLGFEAAFGIRRFVTARVEEFHKVNAHLAGLPVGINPGEQIANGIGHPVDRQLPIKLLDAFRENRIHANDFLAGQKHKSRLFVVDDDAVLTQGGSFRAGQGDQRLVVTDPGADFGGVGSGQLGLRLQHQKTRG